MRVMREKKHQRWKKNLADIFDVSIKKINLKQSFYSFRLGLCNGMHCN